MRKTGIKNYDISVFHWCDYERVFPGMRSSQSGCVALIALEGLDRFYSYLDSKSLSTLDQCTMNLNIPGTKIKALQMGTKTQNHDFIINVQ
jgi:hypothetical protein